MSCGTHFKVSAADVHTTHTRQRCRAAELQRTSELIRFDDLSINYAETRDDIIRACLEVVEHYGHSTIILLQIE